jgi:acyl dehydratase
MSDVLSSSPETVKTLKKMPGIVTLYPRAVLPKLKTAKSASELPALAIELSNIKLNRQKIAKYSNICQLAFNHETLPATYPHILAFNLQMELMVSPCFPLPLLGLVHVKNKINSLRSIKVSESLDMKVSLTEARDTDKGIEFDLATEVFSNEELVWHSVSTYFFRKKSSPGKKEKVTEALHVYRFTQYWNIKENTGRAYALSSSDSNPIHLHKWTAKLFGFKQAIAHGMWTKARALAAFQPLLDNDQFEMEVEFKQPIFLPNRVALQYDETKQGFEFDVRDQHNTRIHMCGTLVKH